MERQSWRSVPIPPPSPSWCSGWPRWPPTTYGRWAHLPRRPHWIPLVLHWNGAPWRCATIPAFPSGGQLRDLVALSPTNVYAVGLDGEGFNAVTLVLHADWVSWTRPATPSPPVGPKLYDAAAVGPSTVWGVGCRYDQRVAANQTLTIRTLVWLPCLMPWKVLDWRRVWVRSGGPVP